MGSACVAGQSDQRVTVEPLEHSRDSETLRAVATVPDEGVGGSETILPAATAAPVDRSRSPPASLVVMSVALQQAPPQPPSLRSEVSIPSVGSPHTLYNSSADGAAVAHASSSERSTLSSDYGGITTAGVPPRSRRIIDVLPVQISRAGSDDEIPASDNGSVATPGSRRGFGGLLHRGPDMPSPVHVADASSSMSASRTGSLLSMRHQLGRAPLVPPPPGRSPASHHGSGEFDGGGASAGEKLH